MYNARPDNVYIADWALRDPRAQERLYRLAAGFGHPNPPVLTPAELAEAVDKHGWTGSWRARKGQADSGHDPDVVLGAYLLDADELAQNLDRYPQLRYTLLGGQGMHTLRDSRWHRQNEEGICQTAVEIHCAYGCLHACQYCHIGNVLTIATNLEALTDALPGLIAANRTTRLWKFDNYTDTICFEPEYGASELMVNFFARESDNFLLLYTKSDNVDHLLELQPRGKTLISWSLAGPRTALLIEKRAPSTAVRINAMRKVQQAGYRVRVRFSPICPIEGWQDDVTAMVEQLFAQVQPELITMDVLGWMNARQMQEALDTSLLDPKFRQFVYEQAEIPPGKHKKHLFPHAWRAEIMRHALREIRRLSPDTPVSICMETMDMWRELGAELRMDPDRYACCCGPDSVPGHPRLGLPA
ncbi:MAG: spore photoproduct lyase family protein [Armatimonadia bacterium]